MTQTVFLTGRWTPPIRARVIAASGALTAAGRTVTVIAPVSPSECGLPDAVGFVPARRRDDAAHALERLRPSVIECHDAAGARFALARLNASPGPTILMDADAVLADPGLAGHAHAVLAPTTVHAGECLNAGVAPERILTVPTPIPPSPCLAPGGEVITCPTPIGPGRGLTELLDAWAASVASTGGRWRLRFAGPLENPAFALAFAGATASCAGAGISERLARPEDDAADCAVLIDPDGRACPSVLSAVARARAVFAPAGSATAHAAGASPFIFGSTGLRGAIGAFDLLADLSASDFAGAGLAARERVLAEHAPSRAVPARLDAYDQAAALPAPAPAPLPEPAQAEWGERFPGRQNLPATVRLQRAMLACHADGLRRVALYGAGEFAKGCADALCEPPLEIVGFIDDDPARRGRRVWGFPVLCPDVALTADLDAVILTAPSCEEALWNRTAWFRRARIRVIPLTRQHPEILPARAA